MTVNEIINKEQFDTATSIHKYVIIKGTATWCGPCKQIQRDYVKLSKEYDNIGFYECDIDEEECPVMDEIRVVPTFLFYHEGKLYDTITGADLKSITVEIKKISEKEQESEKVEEKVKEKVDEKVEEKVKEKVEEKVEEYDELNKYVQETPSNSEKMTIKNAPFCM